jgi:hypothetical protein
MISNLNPIYVIELKDVRLFNQANLHTHWRIKFRHQKSLTRLIKAYWLKQNIKNIPLPCLVIITRYSPRKYDSDNYIYNCKGIRDTISSLIKPGYAPGFADANENDIQWEYCQLSSKAYQLKIEIIPRN